MITISAGNRNSVKVIFCSEFGGIIFPIFMKLLIELKIYHLKEGLKVSSFQFRNDKIYVIKISKEHYYKSKRILNVDSKEVVERMSMNISSWEIWEKLNPVFKMYMKPKENIINNIFENENFIINKFKL
jgi:hypothetical protein